MYTKNKIVKYFSNNKVKNDIVLDNNLVYSRSIHYYLTTRRLKYRTIICINIKHNARTLLLLNRLLH